ncbi:ribosomal protein S18 [Orientia chuto str. Dubai]|uniref:Ribosomal protein S18 n=1 Tax=Orientia chuto str. Dubai TaxID=1359168 RepID=A0A0F3MLB1_9RICK|nr:30S ribosomal protein S18 [Candidatus Orientia mediorientalis]KJV55384.1 ribosomal protein S18 [Orientia chuto str. Dubai]
MIENIDIPKTSTLKNKTLTRTANRTSKEVFFRRRKGCPLSAPNGVAPIITYKDPELLSKFISECGRILPGRVTNVCRAKQRELTKAIKIARELSLLPQ